MEVKSGIQNNEQALLPSCCCLVTTKRDLFSFVRFQKQGVCYIAGCVICEKTWYFHMVCFIVVRLLDVGVPLFDLLFHFPVVMHSQEYRFISIFLCVMWFEPIKCTFSKTKVLQFFIAEASLL